MSWPIWQRSGAPGCPGGAPYAPAGGAPKPPGCGGGAPKPPCCGGGAPKPGGAPMTTGVPQMLQNLSDG
ncbi:MAG: hypothetical protein KF782_03940 [Labilithrix sp.]|nr:hypothetical protein [Labilithrix sp.]